MQEVSKKTENKLNMITSNGFQQNNDKRIQSLWGNYENRIQTFTAWYNKPNEFNIIECVSHGYTMLSIDKIQCIDCKVVILIEPEDQFLESPRAYNNSILNSKHYEYCIFFDNPLPNSFFIPVPSSTTEALTELRNRYTNFPSNMVIDIEVPNVIDISLLLSRVNKDLLLPYMIPLILSLFGWIYDHNKIVCKFCNNKRYIDIIHLHEKQTSFETLMNYVHITDKNYSDLDLEQELTSFSQSSSKEGFNVVENHRYFCPWIKHYIDLYNLIIAHKGTEYTLEELISKIIELVN